MNKSIRVKKVEKQLGIKLFTCESTNVEAYGYSDGYVYVLFYSKYVYKYPLEKHLFQELKTAESKGKWVNQMLVKPKVQYERIEVGE